jgi:hypothetical protein
MLHEGRIEIECTGAFGVWFRSENCEPLATSKIGFQEAEETIVFLIGSLLLPPQEASKAVGEAIAWGRSIIERVVCSDQQLRRIFHPKAQVASARHAS